MAPTEFKQTDFKMAPPEQEKLLRELSRAASSAKVALVAVQPCRDQLLTALEKFEGEVAHSTVSLSPTDSDCVREATAAFATEYGKLLAKLDGLAANTSKAITVAYADLERDAKYVTLMLFGRTRAGKSTTMEAMLGGDGSTMGIGKQHTTTKVKAYYFPKPTIGAKSSQPCLRIVDTPGIEGFKGEALAAMAEEYVERSDHILFLFTDDKASADELDHFGLIQTQGKDVTVLLNVKAGDDDLDLLVSDPAHVFKQEELDGHKRRISGYLQRHFEIPSCVVIPYHARAAWFSRNADRLPDGVDDRSGLERESRIRAVEEHILNFVMNGAVSARRRAPRDLLNGYIVSLKDELRPFAGSFRQMRQTFEELTKRLEQGAERARRRVSDRFPLLRARFQSASDAIPGLVDGVIQTRLQGRGLNIRWKALLVEHGVSNCGEWFVEAGSIDFREELAEEVRVANFEFKPSNVNDLGSLVSDYQEQEDSAGSKKFARAGLRTGAGFAASALTGWAIANWWNPTGWFAAAGAAVVVIGAGIAAEKGARSITDAWEQSTKLQLHKQRSCIIQALRDRLWTDFREAREGSIAWLSQTKDLYLDTAKQTTRPVQSASEKLWHATVGTLSELDDIAAGMDRKLVEEVLHQFVPEVVRNDVKIIAVARHSGFATKVLVSGVGEKTNPLGACIGISGQRVKEVSKALGGEQVHFVDASSSLDLKVLQALGLPRYPPEIVEIRSCNIPQEAIVKLSGMNAKLAIGPRGMNIRLAKELLGLRIQIGVRP